jgi:hypothetical protein
MRLSQLQFIIHVSQRRSCDSFDQSRAVTRTCVEMSLSGLKLPLAIQVFLHPCLLVIFSVPSLARILYSLVAVYSIYLTLTSPCPPTIRPLGPDANAWNACHPAGAQESGRRGSMRLRKMAALPKRIARQKVQYVSQTYDDTCMLLPKSPAHHDERVHVR